MSKKDFYVVSTEVPYIDGLGSCDFLEVVYKMSDAFADAVKNKGFEIILQDDPYQTEFEDEESASALNTRELVHAVHGHGGHYNFDNNTLIVYMDYESVVENFNNSPVEALRKKADNLLKSHRPK